MTLSRMECTKLAQEMQSCHYWLILQHLALVVTTLYTTANPLPTSEAPLMRFVCQTAASNQSLGWPSKPPGRYLTHLSVIWPKPFGVFLLPKQTNPTPGLAAPVSCRTDKVSPNSKQDAFRQNRAFSCIGYCHSHTAKFCTRLLSHGNYPPHHSLTTMKLGFSSLQTRYM